MAIGGNTEAFVAATRGVCGFGWPTVVLLFSSSVWCGFDCSDGLLLFVNVRSFCLFFLSLLLFFSICFVLLLLFLLLFFLSLLFLGCACALHCSGGLCLEVVVVVFAGFRAFVGGKIAFMIGDCCVHPEAFDEGCSIREEEVFGAVLPGIDLGVYTGFKECCAGLVIEEAIAPY